VVIFLANLELRYPTPPVGMNLFLSSHPFDKWLNEISHATKSMRLVLRSRDADDLLTSSGHDPARSFP
jgi:mevalonate pyrophosphate decarboxylase